jgi:FAD:protein FMN transferase
VSIHLGGPSARRAAEDALAALHSADEALSRFRPESELCRLNADPREAVPASPLMLELVAAIREAGELTDGLVDGTLIDEVEAAGYVGSMSGVDTPRLSPPEMQRTPALSRHGWSTLRVDLPGARVMRPPGLRIDSGGLAKGLLADRVGAGLRGAPTFCVNCAGDMLIGGAAHLPRLVHIPHPHLTDPAAEVRLTDGAIATSGVTQRRWPAPDGGWNHHLIDPRTGRPAETGVLQVSALAPSALEAERLAKAALLAGPEGARGWLPHGGVVVLEDDQVVRVPQRAPVAAA